MHFSFSPRETVDLNYQKLITKVMGLCEKYDRFHYDLFKKVYVLNTYILSQVWYISRIIYPPKWFIDQVKKRIRTFLWGIKDKVKYTTIISPKEMGGIKLPDIELRINSQHLMWFKSIFDNNQHNWKFIFEHATNNDLRNISLGNNTTKTYFLIN